MATTEEIVDAIRSLSDEDARTMEKEALVESTGDHALDPAEVVTGDGSS